MLSASSRRSSVGSRNGNGNAVSALRRSLPNRVNDNSVERQSNNEVVAGDGIVKIPVLGYEVKEETGRFTVFKLQVTNEDKSDSWLVFRRYTDFERLAVKLREEFPNLSIISLPPKRWLKNNFDITFLEDRTKGIQAFVDSILIQHNLSKNEIVRAFFCLDEPPLYPENAEESRAIFGTLEEEMLQLKEDLNNRDKEIRLLKQELQLLKLRNETLAKVNSHRVCRSCNIRLSCSTLASTTDISRNGLLPYTVPTSSTPNAKAGQLFRFRNKSMGSDSSSPAIRLALTTLESPESKVSLMSTTTKVVPIALSPDQVPTTPTTPILNHNRTDYFSTESMNKSEVIGKQEGMSPMSPSPPEDELRSTAITPDVNFSKTDYASPERIISSEINGNDTEIMTVSSFEIMQPTPTTSLLENSSFEVLSHGLELSPPSDNNHNKLPAPDPNGPELRTLTD